MLCRPQALAWKWRNCFFTLTCTEKPIFCSNKFFSIYNYLFRFFFLYSVFNEHFLEVKKFERKCLCLCLAGAFTLRIDSSSLQRCFRISLLRGTRSTKARGRFVRYLAVFPFFTSMVGPSGLEPPTSCLSGTRSNLLSYEPMWLVCGFAHLNFKNFNSAYFPSCDKN